MSSSDSKSHNFYHFHPPLPKNDSLYHQTQLAETTIEELQELRKPPTYTLIQKLLHILMFIIFAPLKIICFVIFLIATAPVFLIVGAVWRAVGHPESWRHSVQSIYSSIIRVIMFTFGIYKINYHGKIDPDARFLVPNHVCFFDGWLFLPFGPIPLGKKEILNIPFAKEIAEAFQGIPVDRSHPSGTTQKLIQIASDSSKPIISIFPEGASTSGDYMFRFHLGAFLSDLPVQPVTIRYKIWGTTRSLSTISFFHHQLYYLLVFLGIPGITVDITFLESVSIKQMENHDPRVFADHVALKIGNTLGVKVISLTTSAIFKNNERQSKGKEKQE